MVVLHHMPTATALATVPLVKNAFLFVDFFFVLSGFVIATSYARRLADDFPLGRFMILRFFRVYPLHAFMLLVYLAFEIVFAAGFLGTAERAPFEGAYSPANLGWSALLVQPFMGSDGTPWNGPSWSIAVEFWTYLVFGIVFAFLPRLRVPLCFLIVLAAPVLLALGSDRNMYVFHDGAMTRCLYGFAVGVLCWRLPDRIREIDIGRAGDHALELATAGLTIAFVWFAGAGRLGLAAPFVFGAAVIVFSRGRGAISALLNLRPMVTIGNLSYSIYMVHLFLLLRFVNVGSLMEKRIGVALISRGSERPELTGGALGYAMIVVAMVGVLIAAWLTYRFVEQPGQALGKRIAGRVYKRAP